MFVNCCSSTSSAGAEPEIHTGDMPEYELCYWPITGLGEPIRIAFALGGQAFKDSTPKNDEGFAARKEASGQQVPFMFIDGKPAMGQARALLRYIGKEMKYEGKPLYPTDSMEAYWADELIELVMDMFAPLPKTFEIKDQAEKEAARAALFVDGGAVAKFLVKIDKRLEKFGPNPHIGDIYCFNFCNMCRQPTFIDGIPAGILDQYPNITRHHEWIANLPPVKEYYKDAVEIRTTYKPFN